MFKDKLVTGIIVGLLADAVKLTVNYISFRLGFAKVVFWQMIAALFLERRDVFTPLGLIIGGVADIVITSLLGIIFIYTISYIGSENLWIKGIGFGMVVWVVFFGIVLEQLIADKIPPEPSGIIVTIAAHFAYGLSLAIFTKLLAKDELLS